MESLEAHLLIHRRRRAAISRAARAEIRVARIIDFMPVIASGHSKTPSRAVKMDFQGELAFGSAAGRKVEDDCEEGCSPVASPPNTPGTALSHNRVRPHPGGRTRDRATPNK